MTITRYDSVLDTMMEELARQYQACPECGSDDPELKSSEYGVELLCSACGCCQMVREARDRSMWR